MKRKLKKDLVEKLEMCDVIYFGTTILFIKLFLI